MITALRRRLKALEQAMEPHGGCNVIEYGLNEQPADAMARARAAGLRGGFLLLPVRLTAEVWEPLARAHQANLTRH